MTRLGKRILCIPDTQCCTKCGTDKPISAYNFRKDRGQPYRQCRDCMAARKWSVKNPERQRATVKAWEANNQGRLRAIWREMAARKRERDPVRRIHGRISNQIYAVLRRGKNCRSAFELVGYSFSELKAHLERQFTPGMGWHNVSKWHIDHIVPLSSFSIIGPDDPELRRAWALANLRPLWAADNLRKGAKREVLL
jgi:hypothetical protein